VPEPLRLVVWTPSETLLDVQGVRWVHVELADGRPLTIWPGHLSMIGETVPATLRYTDAAGEHQIELPAGIVHVCRATVTVFLAGGREAVGGPVRLDRLSDALVAAIGRGQQPADRAEE
jgi:F0F1-type ATP synthase epsilon subunit